MTGRRRGSWTTLELTRLRELYPTTTTDRIARLLGRASETVRRRAEFMFGGLLRGGPWTRDEDERLREIWGAHELSATARVLRRSPNDVTERARRLAAQLRSGSWNDDEVARLKRLFGTRSDDDLVVCLSRSRAEIEVKASELCLAKDKAAGIGSARMPRWTASEIAHLRALYPRHANLTIARELSRSVASVANKAHQIGLAKSPATLRAMGAKNVSKRRNR